MKLFQIVSGYLNCDFSYVTQDDVIMGTLTVRENLEFAANLRLRNCTRRDIEERVNELIHDLGLEKCMDTKVGTELIKGVSGGERKRCNIGIELVTKPMVLFLGMLITILSKVFGSILFRPPVFFMTPSYKLYVVK